jgi:DNA repair protein RAD50
LISEISAQNNIKGYDYAPLEREKIIEFISRLNELQRKQKLEFGKLQVS